MTKPIAKVPELRPVRRKLEKLGYTNLEGVFDLGDVVPKALLYRYLRHDLAYLLRDVPRPQVARVRKSVAGVNLNRIPRKQAFNRIPAGKLPRRVDHSRLLRNARDQGGRWTCVAFATAAVLEAGMVRLRRSKKPSASPEYSPEFIYYGCKQHDKSPTTRGTYARAAFKLLVENGVCPEAICRYEKSPTTEGGRKPSAKAWRFAASARINGFLNIRPTSVEQIRSQLAAGFCVAFSFPIFASWFASPEVMRSGDLVVPLPHEKEFQGHCVCLVGYRLDKSRPGGGEFFCRNSWDSRFGKKSKLKRVGFGTIPFEFVAKYGREAYSLSKDWFADLPE